MRIQLDQNYTAEWVTGGHYWYISDGNGEAHSAWSFGWELNRPTQQQALEAFITHEILLMAEAMS